MNSLKLFIPEKLKIGFQVRSDTYTKMLGYIIYYDEKGTLRKEKSWESWRSKNIDPIEIDNVPTEGFVLNKNGGGSGRGWDSRQAFIRVWDPRGFEFEISVTNLLFILRLCDCSKGKGLEGKFVYSWDGTELVLLPEQSEDFKTSVEFTELKSQKVSARELKVGVTYITKSMDELLYLGKKDYYDTGYSSGGNYSKRFIFWNGSSFEYHKNISHLANLKSETIPENFAELNEMYYKSKHGSKPVSLILKDIPSREKTYYGFKRINWYIKTSKETYKCNTVELKDETNEVVAIESSSSFSFSNNLVQYLYDRSYSQRFWEYSWKTRDYVRNLNPIPDYKNNSLWVVLESGVEIEVHEYLRR